MSHRDQAPGRPGSIVRPSFRRTASIALLVLMVSTSFMALASSEAERHVALVDTMNDQQRAQLKASGATVLEDYGDLAMVSGTEAQLSMLSIRRDLDDRTIIDMAGFRFDTRYPIDGQGIPEGYLQDAPTEGTGYFLVQLKGPVKQAWTDDITALGAEVLNYIPNYAYIVRMDASLTGAVKDLPFVSYVGNYQPAFKVAPDVRDATGPLTINVVLYQGEDMAPVVWDLLTMGADITSVSDQLNPTIEATVLDAAVPRVARLGPVMAIDMRYKGGLPPNDPAQWISQSNTQNYYPLYDHGLHGENMTIGNADTGISVSHYAYYDANHAVQYSDPATNTPPDLNHRKIVNYWKFAPDQGVDSYGHGSMTVGVNVGDNDANNGNPQYHGMAYKAKVSFQDVWDDTPFTDARPADKSKLYQKSYDDGARVHSGSMVCVAGGAYNDDAQELDQFLWGHKDFIGVIANHNYGQGDVSNSVCDMASAKDTMSMGAAQNTPNQDDLHDYTGRGPTDDGRLKPTISATTDINAPATGTQNGFSNLGGTSGATPDAAGNTILARQYFYDGFYPSGARSPSDGFNASGALLKAISINSADEMSHGIAYHLPYNGMNYPSNTQGWGRLDLDNSLYFVGDSRGLIIDDNTTGLSTGATADYTVGVVSNNEPLRITLVWTDYWGQISAGKELVNDLDLQVTAPDGSTVFKGNKIGGSAYPHESVTGGSFDSVNVEENIINMTPALGGWAIKVTAVNTPQGPQPYALVITGNLSRQNDLAVTPANIVFSKTDPVEGDNVTVDFTVRNLGGNPLPAVDTKVDLDGKLLLSKTIAIAGGAGKFNLTWQSTWGDHVFKITVDPLGLIPEAREDNNVAQRSIYVNKMPIASFIATPLVIYTFDNITVNASASTDDGNVTKYKFDWGEGQAQNWGYTEALVHQYKKVGQFNVTVKVMDNTSLESPWAPKVTITVKNRDPYINATASAYSVYTLINISFDASKSSDVEGPVTYAWDLGDGNKSTASKLTHWFAEDGYYNVSLTIKDTNAATNSTKLMVHVLNRAPTATFKASGKAGNVTTQFNFVPKVEDLDGKIVTFLWDFGDGTTSDKEAPIHYFKDDGTFNVSLFVLDNDGARSGGANWTVTIYNLPPVAGITPDVLEALTGGTINFVSNSTDIDGTIVNLTWNMGDGTFLYGKTVTHEFKDNKVYHISLKIIDDDEATAEANITVKINDRPPMAVADYDHTGVAGKVIVLSALNSSDPDGTIVSYLWNFGNNSVKREAVVNFTYWSAGTHYINLTVTDNDRSTDTIMLTVTISPAPPPPKPPVHKAMDLTYILIGVIVAVIAVALIAVAVMMKGRKKGPEQQPAPNFDPNSMAAMPPPDGQIQYNPETVPQSGTEQALPPQGPENPP